MEKSVEIIFLQNSLCYPYKILNGLLSRSEKGWIVDYLASNPCDGLVGVENGSAQVSWAAKIGMDGFEVLESQHIDAEILCSS